MVKFFSHHLPSKLTTVVITSTYIWNSVYYICHYICVYLSMLCLVTLIYFPNRYIFACRVAICIFKNE